MDLIGQLSNPRMSGVADVPDDASMDTTGSPATERIARSRGPRQKQTRLKPAQVDELVEARAAGATIMEIAEQYGIHRTTVMAHFQRRGGPPSR